VVRQGHFIAVVKAFLIGYAVLLLVVGCAGVRSGASKKEQGHTEATKDQAHSERCELTRTMDYFDTLEALDVPFITNDVPGCPKGGLLSGTNKPDHFAGKDGQDEIRGLGEPDDIEGGLGGDFIYGGPGNDYLVATVAWSEEPPEGSSAGPDPPTKDLSKNVLHGGPSRDELHGAQGEDVLYGEKGDDPYIRGDSAKDILYGGPGHDALLTHADGQRDEL
jgi:uncharacterized protein YceK